MPRTSAAVLALVALLTACAGSRPSPAPARAVTVLVYNIHAGKDASRRENLERVAALVASTSADLVLLQEVDRNTERSGVVDQPAALARLTGYHAAFGRTISFQGGDYGLALLSRWPIVRDTLIHLPVVGDSLEVREQRGVLRAEVAAPGGRITVLNTHLDATGTDRWRIQEIATVARLAGTGSPVLVGGDFNAAPGSAVHGELRAAGLRDVWAGCGEGDPLTFPADVPLRRIDYLYVEDGIACERATVLASDASDHRPLLVRLRLR